MFMVNYIFDLEIIVSSYKNILVVLVKPIQLFPGLNERYLMYLDSLDIMILLRRYSLKR